MAGRRDEMRSRPGALMDVRACGGSRTRVQEKNSRPSSASRGNAQRQYTRGGNPALGFGAGTEDTCTHGSRHVWLRVRALFVRCLFASPSSCTSALALGPTVLGSSSMLRMSTPDGPAPALALDDILHTMSPSPAPPSPLPQPGPSTLPEHALSQTPNYIPESHLIADTSLHPPRMSSPEPLDHPELESMRARAHHYSLSSNTTSERESELAAMVRSSCIASNHSPSALGRCSA